MKTLVKQLYSFFKEDFDAKSYIWATIFIGIAITINYSFKFQSNYIYSNDKTFIVCFRFFLFYSLSWFIVAIPKLYFTQKLYKLKSTEFWIKILLFIGLISITSGFRFDYKWFEGIHDHQSRIYITKILTQLKCLTVYTLPFILMAKIYDKTTEGIYGLNLKFGNGKTYLLLLALVAPLIIATSFTPDFIQAYPRFRVWQFESMTLMPSWLSTSAFESVYILDFAMTEWMFRGALVIGMVALLGKDAILPMVSIYVFLHFGKPLGETISSFFGGYLLGVLAYSTRHIWGGVLLHAGIALIMEMMGLLQYYVMGMHR